MLTQNYTEHYCDVSISDYQHALEQRCSKLCMQTTT